MKHVIFITLGMFFAFLHSSMAQESRPLADTLIIKVEDRNQIHISGISFRAMREYDRADSLKHLFFADLRQAFQNESIPEDTRRVHYLVAADGQRRMKAALDPYTEEVFDLEKERYRLHHDLPPYTYIIYDLQDRVQVHFFLEDTGGLAQLERVDLSQAIQTMAEDKSNIRRRKTVTLQGENDNFNKTAVRGSGYITFETISPLGGIMVIGNQLSPTLGFDMNFEFRDKNNIGLFQFVITDRYFALTEFKEGEFTRFDPYNWYSVSLYYNPLRKLNGTQWLGLEIGLPGAYDDMTLLTDPGLSFGFVSKFNKVQLGIGSMRASFVETAVNYYFYGHFRF